MKKQSKKSIPAWREHLLQANIQIGELRRELAELKKQVAKTEEHPQRDIEDVTLGGLKFPRRSLPTQKEVQQGLAYIFDRLVRTNYIHFTWRNELGAALYLWLDALKGTYYDIYRNAVISNRRIRSAVLVLRDEARNEDKEQYYSPSLVLEDLTLPEAILTPPRKSAFDDEEEADAEELPVKQPKNKSNLFKD